MTVFAVAIAVGASLKYQSIVYGNFVWEIHVRYNNIVISTLRYMLALIIYSFNYHEIYACCENSNKYREIYDCCGNILKPISNRSLFQLIISDQTLIKFKRFLPIQYMCILMGKH